MKPTQEQVRARLRDESGLIGKIILAWLLVLALGAVAAIDAGSILLARYRAESAADLAAEAGAVAYAADGDAVGARAASEAAVAAADADARLTGFRIGDDGTVQVTLTVTPQTIAAERLAFVLGDVATVRVRSTAGPPGA